MIDTYEEIHVKTESMAGHRNRERDVVPVVGLGVVASRLKGVDVRGSNSRLPVGNPIHHRFEFPESHSHIFCKSLCKSLLRANSDCRCSGRNTLPIEFLFVFDRYLLLRLYL